MLGEGGLPDHHSLGLAGGAGGVDDVGRAREGGEGCEVGRCGGHLAGEEDRGGERAGFPTQGRRGDQAGRGAVFGDGEQAPVGCGRVDGDVGGAAKPGAEDRGEEVGAARQEENDVVAGPHSALMECVGHGVCAVRQAGVGELAPIGLLDGARLRALAGTGEDVVEDGLAGGAPGVGVVECGADAGALFGRDDVELAQGTVEAVGQLLQNEVESGREEGGLLMVGGAEMMEQIHRDVALGVDIHRVEREWQQLVLAPDAVHLCLVAFDLGAIVASDVGERAGAEQRLLRTQPVGGGESADLGIGQFVMAKKIADAACDAVQVVCDAGVLIVGDGQRADRHKQSDGVLVFLAPVEDGHGHGAALQGVRAAQEVCPCEQEDVVECDAFDEVGEAVGGTSVDGKLDPAAAVLAPGILSGVGGLDGHRELALEFLPEGGGPGHIGVVGFIGAGAQISAHGAVECQRWRVRIFSQAAVAICDARQGDAHRPAIGDDVVRGAEETV